MTIKKKIYMMSALMVLVFAATSFMSFWTHQQVLTNLQIRDSVNLKLAALEEHAEWKNDFIRLMSNMAAAGRVPVFVREEFKALSNVIEEKNSALIETARTLMNIIIKKEKASRDVEKNFGKIRSKINELYFRLDKEISTALALAQMDQVLGVDAAEKSDLAPYVLKSLNQLTLTGLNALVSRKNFTEEQKGIVAKNAKFIRTQVHTIDTDKKILPLFENLFLQLNRLDEFIADSKELLSGVEKQISIADTEFKKTADSKAMDLKAAAARSEAALANKTLENASRLNFILGVICLIIVPLAAAVVGIMGLNSFIVRPISRLAKAMKNVEEGRFDVTAPAETQDEIGSLGRSFNAMTEKLHASFKKIEQKNRHLKDEHDRFLTIMDAMNAFVYVTDPETYEVLFMNRCGRKIWANRIGEKCWEVLQADQNGPCGFCGMNEMTGSGSASEVDSWEYQNTKNGEWYQCSGRRILWPGGRTVNLLVAANITKIKKAEKEHLSHLHFLQTMDRIDRVIHRASDIHRMLEDIIKTVFSVFGCDRACLIYPCDPDASVFRIPMACTAGDYPLPVDLNVDLSLSDGFERAFRDGLASDEPVIYLAGNETPFLDETEQKLGIRSQMMTALHPKMGKPWLFGIHQCSQNRLWTEEEKRLFKEIGRRIADGLSSMLLLESLRESEERYRQIVEGTDNLVTEVDHEGRFVFVNETGLKIFGLRPEECAGLSALDFIHPDDREQTLQQFDRALEKKAASLEIENRQVSASGEIRDMLWTCNFCFSEKGNITTIKGIARDITERKRIESEMIRLQSLMKNILNSMPSILLGVDHEENVIQWNHEAEKAAGIPANEAIGRKLADVFPRLTGQTDRVRQAIREGKPKKDARIADKKNGNTVFSDMTIYPLISNGVDGAVIRFDDVTDRVRMEEMMIQSEKMLSVGGLAAGMAHEINNPLAGIMQTANVLKNRLGENIDIPANRRAAEAAGTSMQAIQRFMESRAVLRMIDTISSSGTRVAAIVENMLSFARKSDSTVSTHVLNEIIDSSLKLAATDYSLKKQYDFKGIAIERDYEEHLPPVPCEKAKIQQVLLNLFGNGAQAMQDAGVENPRFKIRTRFEREREMVCVEIEDNGPGMDEATRKRVFEPFFTTKPAGVGTGLGLSISFFIITENHNGEMTVESRPGAGAKFIICLPEGRIKNE